MDVVDICKEYMSRSPSHDSFVVWTHTGGKIRKPDQDSCYAHRDAEFTFELKSEWDATQPALTRPNVEWAVKFFDALGKHAQGAYLNYIDPLQLDWQKSYYRDKYDRLLKIRDHWDPEGKFNFQQGIGSDYVVPPRKFPLDLSPLSRTFSSTRKTEE
jgi:Berberine and berberine like